MRDEEYRIIGEKECEGREALADGADLGMAVFYDGMVMPMIKMKTDGCAIVMPFRTREDLDEFIGSLKRVADMAAKAGWPDKAALKDLPEGITESEAKDEFMRIIGKEREE